MRFEINQLPNFRWEVEADGKHLSGPNGCVDLDAVFQLIRNYLEIQGYEA